jgi:hypothetical protein
VAVLPIPDPLGVSILRGHRTRQLEERFTAGTRWRETGLVFTTASGGLANPSLTSRTTSRLVRVSDAHPLAGRLRSP